MSLVEEIAVKSAALPVALQQKVLNLVNSMIESGQKAQNEMSAAPQKRPPFKSVRGILSRKLETFEEDLAEVRREMWQNFPRDEPR